MPRGSTSSSLASTSRIATCGGRFQVSINGRFGCPPRVAARRRSRSPARAGGWTSQLLLPSRRVMAQTQFSAITRFQLVQMWSTIFKSFILHGAFKTHSVSRTAPDFGCRRRDVQSEDSLSRSRGRPQGRIAPSASYPSRQCSRKPERLAGSESDGLASSGSKPPASNEGNSPRGSFPHVQSCARER
jgi:hypothetical protein